MSDNNPASKRSSGKAKRQDESSRGVNRKLSEKTSAGGKRKAVPKAASRDRPELFPVVGLGSSAGGLESLREFFSAMPAQNGMAFVIVQHLKPDHESMLGALLAKHTSMPVVSAVEGLHLQPDHIYVISPRPFTILKRNGKKLSFSEVTGRIRMPIDYFFRSLGVACEEKAICIVLSGTGSDGTLGLKSVRETGGLVLAEDPYHAQSEGMPRSAIRGGLADFVLRSGKMPEVLARYTAHPFMGRDGSQAASLTQSSDGLKAVFNALNSRPDYDFRSYKKGTLTRRIERRMGLLNLKSTHEYLQLLHKEPEEYDRLFRDLLIGVTSFFRDPEAWTSLGKQVRSALKKKEPSEPFRVWVVGCSTGEEAYSVAMVLSELVSSLHVETKPVVFATDIDERAIAKARSGRYPSSISTELSPERIKAFFGLHNEEYVVGKKLRELVVFANQNVISDPPFSNLDLICCRNMLIYLEPKVQKKLVELFHFVLAENGMLFLSSSESAGSQDGLFRALTKKHRIYKKKGGNQKRGSRFRTAGWEPPAASEFSKRKSAGPREKRTSSYLELARNVLLERYVPASVLIDQDFRLLFYHGATGDFLEYPAGEPTNDLNRLIIPGLRSKLMGAIRRVATDDAPATVEQRRFRRGRQEYNVTLKVEPVAGKRDGEKLFLVSFTKKEPPLREAKELVVPEELDVVADGIVSQLEYELKATREDLQSTIEEVEASNEELKASNEEIISMNEELQSANEELETSREELQSLNEELGTVNNELEASVQELESANNDMNNLLSSTDIATVFLDQDFCIRRYTPAVNELMSLIPSDIGRPFSDIALRFKDERLMDDARKVLEKLTPIESQVTNTEGRSFVRRILPYRTDDNRIPGVVVTFTDITEVHGALERLRIREHQQAQVSHLGRLALSNAPVPNLIREAAKELAESLPVDFTKILELLPDGKELLLRGGVGWKRGMVGRVKISTDLSTQAGYTLESSRPVIVTNLAKETRFRGPKLLADLGIVSGMSVIIPGHGRPWGVLGVHARTQTDFTLDDVHFLQSVANILSDAILRQRADQKVRESEKRLRLVTDSLPVLVSYCDRDLNYRFCNAAYEEWFGIGREEMIGRNVREVLGQKAFESLEPIMAAVLRGERQSLEREIPYRHSEPKFVHIDYIPDQTENGRVEGFYVMVQDLTERRRAEEATNRLAAIVVDSEDAIYSKDLSGTITSWNLGAERIYGYAAEEVIGKKATMLIPKERRTEVNQMLKKIAEGGRVAHHDTLRLRKDGTLVHISIAFSPIRSKDGETTGASIVARDITDRVEAERLLKENRARLAQVMASISDAFLSFDEEWRYTFINDTAEKLLGASADTLLGRGIWEGLVEKEAAPFFEAMQATRATGEVRDVEAFYHPTQRWYSCRCYPRDEGGVSVYFQDQTEERRAKSALLESERRFRKALEDAPLPVAVIADDGELLLVSRQVWEITGFQPEDLPDLQAWVSLVKEFGAKQRQTAEGLIEQLFSQTEPQENGIHRVPVKGGDVRHWQVFTSPLGPGPDGRKLIVTMAHDITEQRITEERLRLALVGGEMGIFEVDVQSGHCTFDSKVTELLGFDSTVSECKLEEFAARIHPEDQENWKAAAGLVLSGKGDYDVEFRYLRPDGRAIWLAGKGLSVGGTDDHSLRWVGINYDITARKEIEQELRELNRHLEHRVEERTAELAEREDVLDSIIQTAADGIISVCAQGKILSFNNAAREMFGYQDKEVIGMPVERLFIAGLGNDMKSLLRRWKRNSEQELVIERGEGEAIGASGTGFPVEYVISQSPSRSMVILIVQDISQRRRLEQEVFRASEEEKERIAADLHDNMGSMLSGIDCRVEVLRGKLAAQNLAEREEIEKISSLVKEAISQSRELAHGLHALGMEEGALMNALRQFAERLKANHRMSSRFHCPEKVEVKNPFVANHLFRIVQEASNNAIKHSGCTRITVGIRADEDRVVVTVRDNGTGFNREKVEGDGIGLDIMRYRANAIRGTITVQPRKQGGTEVICSVPMAVCQDPGKLAN